MQNFVHKDFEFVNLFFEDPAKVYTDNVITGATGENAGARYKAPFDLSEKPDTEIAAVMADGPGIGITLIFSS